MTEPLRPADADEELADRIDNIVPSHGYEQVPLVGLGGSAGSIEALQAFFSAVPADCGIAFAVVIHLSPEHESTLDQLLQRHTRMKVVQVARAVKVEPGSVYVIPPAKALRTHDGRLEVSDLPAHGSAHVAVDIFFRTLAESHGPHAAAVVLSGVDGDGAIGIKRIKERGGLTVAQDPEEAHFGGMPRSAIATNMVDWVLPVAEIAPRLLAYFRIEKDLALPPEETPATPEGRQRKRDEADLHDVLKFLRTRTGRDFSFYKRATVLRRIARRMQVNGVDNLRGYMNCLRTRPGESAALLQDLLISVTNFFRDGGCFEALQTHVPGFFAGKGPADVVRVWVLACATGEEAYSVAILLSEYARTLEAPPMLQIFATDLDEQAVRIARDGVYPDTIRADVSEERLRRYFLKDSRGFRVRRELREQVLFAAHDALKDSPFSRLDLVTCRNLLIYLTRDAQARLLETLNFALVPQGRLMLGSSESVDEGSPLFSVLDKKHRIYAQRPMARTGMPMPSGAGTLRMALDAPAPDLAGPVIGALVQDPTITHARRETLRTATWAEIHLKLLEHLAPPSVLVDEDYEIVHLSPSAGRFLQLSGGEPTRNLLRTVPPEVRIELRGALSQAGQNAAPAEIPAVAIDLPGGGPTMTAIRVAPMTESGHTMYLVSFEVVRPAPQRSAADRPEPDPLARHLDREIERLKSHLRDTVEQYEASTEELKASNEELQAMNEELRAATEELETSREELQSINEELTTVNHELKSKVDQLSHANSDMHNLMGATQIATVFLDRELRITRYTPKAVELFNLIPTDLGRPLTDMATKLDYERLGDDARLVLERLVPVEREVGPGDGRWFLARLVPYRTLEDRIAGVVFTFIDITERKHAEEMRQWLAAVVTASADAIISFALDGTILSWNGGAERLFGWNAAEAIGQPLGVLASTRDAEPVEVLAEVAQGRSFELAATVLRRKDGSDVHVAMNASPIHDSSGQVVAATSIVRDVTSSRTAAEALRQSEEQLRLVMENAREYAIFSTDLERRITVWNHGAQRLLGYTRQEAVGLQADVVFTDEDRAADAPGREARTAFEEGRAADERLHRRKDGSVFRGSGILMLMRDEAGQPIGYLKILRDLTQPVPEPR